MYLTALFFCVRTVSDKRMILVTFVETKVTLRSNDDFILLQPDGKPYAVLEKKPLLKGDSPVRGNVPKGQRGSGLPEANKPLLVKERWQPTGWRRGYSSQSTEKLSFTFYDAQAAMAFTLPHSSGKVNKAPFYLGKLRSPQGSPSTSSAKIGNCRRYKKYMLYLTPFKTTVPHIHSFSSAWKQHLIKGSTPRRACRQPIRLRMNRKVSFNPYSFYVVIVLKRCWP